MHLANTHKHAHTYIHTHEPAAQMTRIHIRCVECKMRAILGMKGSFKHTCQRGAHERTCLLPSNHFGPPLKTPQHYQHLHAKRDRNSKRDTDTGKHTDTGMLILGTWRRGAKHRFCQAPIKADCCTLEGCFFVAMCICLF